MDHTPEDFNYYEFVEPIEDIDLEQLKDTADLMEADVAYQCMEHLE